MPPVCDVHHVDVMADRRVPVGAELDGEGVSFRVWAPAAPSVDVILESGPGSPATITLDPEGDGYCSAGVVGAGAGTRYRFRLGDAAATLPDPASRFQPQGPHGPSEVVDPAAFEHVAFFDEEPLTVSKATLGVDGKTVRLGITDLAPTWGMEIRYRLKGADGRAVTGVIHNTIHAMGG